MKKYCIHHLKARGPALAAAKPTSHHRTKRRR
jgi:hypothetical protein